MFLSQILILIVLLCFSALFSASETALSSLGKFRVKEAIGKYGKRAHLLNRWLEEPNRLLTTILVGNNLVNIWASVLAATIVLQKFQQKGVAITTGLMTFLILVFGEITPKTFAKQNAERISLLLIKPLIFLSYLLFPLVKFLGGVSIVIIRLFGGRVAKQTSRISEKELKDVISVGEREGVIEEEEKEMIHSIFEFGDTLVKEVMTPRTGIIALEDASTLKEVLDLMVREGHSRIPAYRENVDQIVGIVYSKDLLKQWQEGKLEKPAKELMRPPYFIPETKRVNELLREFQRHKISVAIVIDEYGGTAGLVTMEDLLEEIVGEISDHWEKKAPDFQKLPDGTILVNGKMEIERVNEELEMGLPEENDVETLAGFILSYVGRFPKVGETFRFKNLSFTIQTADEHSISLVQIKRLDLKTDKKIR